MFLISATLTLELSMNGCRKAKVSCTKKREFNSKIRIFLKDFLALLKSLHVKNFIEKKTSWYDMRPLDQIGLVRKLEVVHKQVGGFMILKLSTKWRLYGQWRGYVVTSCRCYVVRYVGIELLGQLKSFNSKSVSIVIAVELLYWANNGVWLSGLKSSGLVVERH